jgi:predicted RNase H-like HicB family nuclease
MPFPRPNMMEVAVRELTAKLRVVVHQADEGGYWAEVPALPGCFTQAETLAELRANVQAAVDLYLDEKATVSGARRKAP